MEILWKILTDSRFDGGNMRVNEGSDIVHEGTDGWLFLVGGTNHPLSYFGTEENEFTDSVRDAWVTLLKCRNERCAELGARYIHLLAPEKLSVYPEFARLNLRTDLRPGARLRTISAISPFFLDPTAFFELVKEKTKAQLYWKTDTHWTYQGAYAASQILMSRLNLRSDPELISRPFSEGMVSFDLGSKMAPPVSERARFYRPVKNSVRIYANELVRYQEKNADLINIELHVGKSVIYRNDVNPVNDKAVVIFGDSFSEYRPSLLTGILAESFREAHFLWTANMDFDYIAQVKPDYVISESAERFMSRVPTDDVNFDSFVAARLARLDVS